MGWQVEIGRDIQTGRDKLNNNVLIQTGICKKQLATVEDDWIYNSGGYGRQWWVVVGMVGSGGYGGQWCGWWMGSGRYGGQWWVD